MFFSNTKKVSKRKGFRNGKFQEILGCCRPFTWVIWLSRPKVRKKVSEGVPRLPHGPKRSESNQKSDVFLDSSSFQQFRLFSDFLGPQGREITGTPFKTLFRTSGRKARITPAYRQRRRKHFGTCLFSYLFRFLQCNANHPNLLFLAFFDFLAFVICKEFLVFYRFPFFHSNLRGSARIKILGFLVVFLAFFSFKKSKKKKVRAQKGTRPTHLGCKLWHVVSCVCVLQDSREQC